MAAFQAPATPEGPPHYLALSLRLPAAATSAQRSRGQRGVSIDLILDTGATANVLSPAVARELALPTVGVQAAGRGDVWAGHDLWVGWARTRGSCTGL